jgi:hypothetical protein
MKTTFLLTIVTAFAAAVSADEAPTFTKDVVPILQKRCQGCHRPGDIAPMSLFSYQETRPWAASIRENVLKGTMPPWHADPRYGVFSNDRRLTREEIDTLVRWADAGAPEGDRADLPPPAKLEEGWSIGKPDLVLSMTEEFAVDPKGQDRYLYFAIPTNFEEDRYVKAIELRPGNRKVVHHALVFLKPKSAPLRSRSQGDMDRFNQVVGFPLFKVEGDVLRVERAAPVHDDACGLEDGGSALPGDVSEGRSPLIYSFTPGARGDVLPEGIGIKIPKESELMLQIHYARSDTVEKDRSSVGLIFTREQPKQLIHQQWVQNYYFKIPAHAENHEARGCHTLKKDIELRAILAHMHLRGKDMEIKAFYPGGEGETLLRVPAYDFNWQTTYWLKEPRLLPAGTRLEATAHYDNSRRNAFNPDPEAAVRWGDPTTDEMLIAGLAYTERPTAAASPEHP